MDLALFCQSQKKMKMRVTSLLKLNIVDVNNGFTENSIRPQILSDFLEIQAKCHCSNDGIAERLSIWRKVFSNFKQFRVASYGDEDILFYPSVRQLPGHCCTSWSGFLVNLCTWMEGSQVGLGGLVGFDYFQRCAVPRDVCGGQEGPNTALQRGLLVNF